MIDAVEAESWLYVHMRFEDVCSRCSDVARLLHSHTSNTSLEHESDTLGLWSSHQVHLKTSPDSRGESLDGWNAHTGLLGGKSLNQMDEIQEMTELDRGVPEECVLGAEELRSVCSGTRGVSLWWTGGKWTGPNQGLSFYFCAAAVWLFIINILNTDQFLF